MTEILPADTKTIKGRFVKSQSGKPILIVDTCGETLPPGQYVVSIDPVEVEKESGTQMPKGFSQNRDSGDETR